MRYLACRFYHLMRIYPCKHFFKQCPSALLTFVGLKHAFEIDECAAGPSENAIAAVQFDRLIIGKRKNARRGLFGYHEAQRVDRFDQAKERRRGKFFCRLRNAAKRDPKDVGSSDSSTYSCCFDRFAGLFRRSFLRDDAKERIHVPLEIRRKSGAFCLALTFVHRLIIGPYWHAVVRRRRGHARDLTAR